MEPRFKRRLIEVAILLFATFPQSLALSIYDVYEPLHVVEGQLSWGDLRLGMSPESVGTLMPEPLALSPMEYETPSFAVYSTIVDYRGRKIELWFDDRMEGKTALSSIRVRRNETDSAVTWDRSVMLQQAHKRLPGILYKASRHDPEVLESAADRPMYTLPTAPHAMLWLEPGFSIAIVHDTLLD